MNQAPLPRRIVQSLVSSDLLWALFAPLVRIGRSLDYWRALHEERRCADRVFHARQVLHGPFKGMRYATMEGLVGSPWPRLLGTHESELHPWIESRRGKSYEVIADVGCAEGFYVTGFARMFPEVRVTGFDTDPEMQRQCLEMAQLNGVSSRVEVRGRCSPDELALLIRDKCCLVICDCEGCERDLMTSAVAAAGAASDFLIEVHDFTSREIEEGLRAAFSATHHITAVPSISTARKAAELHRNLLPGEPPSLRQALMNEHRSMDMKWLLMEPLKTTHAAEPAAA